MRRNPVVIFRTTDTCNLDCIYCYDKNNRDTKVNVNQQVIEKIDDIVKYFEKIFINKDKSCSIIFHGGEPLMLSPNTYEKLLNKIKFKNLKLSIQTNGTLINEEYIKIFKKYNINVGISLDGCDEEQNYCRIYKDGRNSFEQVMKNIQLLKDNEIKFGIIMTISKKHIGKEKMIYEFIANKQLNINIRPAFPTKNNNNNNIMSEEEYAEFFKNMFDIWYNDQEKKVKLKQIREIYDAFALMLDGKYCSGLCTNAKSCFGKFISLDINGDIYTCNRTYGNQRFKIGNLNKQTMDEILEKSKEFSKNRVNKLEKSKCFDCELYKHCYGGCPANAYNMYEDYTKSEDFFCEAKKEIYAYIKDKLEETDEIKKYNEKKK